MPAIRPLPEPSMPKLWQKIRFLHDPFSLLAAARRECGDIFALHVPGMGRVVFLCSAELLNEVYHLPEKAIVAGEIRDDLLGRLTGSRASISIDGPEYIERRRVMTPHFSGHGLLRHTGDIRRFAEEMIAGWPVDRAFHLLPYCRAITSRNVCRLLYGSFDAEREARLVHLSQTFLERFRSPAVQIPWLQRGGARWSPWGRFVAAREELGAMLAEEIRLRAAGPELENGGLLSGLVAAGLDDDEEEARRIAIDEIRSLLVGGTESTSTVMLWTFTALLKTPAVTGRLREELAAVLGDRGIEAADLRHLPYLDAVVHEGVRYQSVGPMAAPRRTHEDVELGGFRIPAGLAVVQCFSELARSPVFANPDRFDPDHFFERDVKQRDWVPFGGGPRVCMGMGLARLELAVVVATVIQRAELELAGGSTRPVQRGMTFVPRNGLKVRLARPPG